MHSIFVRLAHYMLLPVASVVFVSKYASAKLFWSIESTRHEIQTTIAHFFLHTQLTHIIQQVYRWLTKILCNLLFVQLVRKKLLLNPSFYKKERIFAHIHTNAIKLTTITSFGDIILLQLVERLACVHMTITLLASCNSILHYLVFIDINASNWRMAIPQLYSFTVNLIMCAHQIIFFFIDFFFAFAFLRLSSANSCCR